MLNKPNITTGTEAEKLVAQELSKLGALVLDQNKGRRGTTV